MHYKTDLNEIRAELDWWLSGSHEPVMGTQKEQEELRSTIFTLSQSDSYMLSNVHHWNLLSLSLTHFRVIVIVTVVSSSPQNYVFSISETWILSELPVCLVCQPHVPSTGIFGFPEEEENNYWHTHKYLYIFV